MWRADARAALILVLLGAALAPLARPAAAPPPPHPAAAEPPTHWDGRRLRPLALGAIEQRFAARFPGTIARLTDGHRVIVLREVRTPTRMLHPAADCYRGLGYRIEQARLEDDAAGRRWRCFVARAAGGGAALRVCERITGPDGHAWTDSSAWFWAAAAGVSHGPWQAVTVAEPLPRPQNGGVLALTSTQTSGPGL